MPGSGRGALPPTRVPSRAPSRRYRPLVPGNGLDADTEQLPWRKIVTFALAVPGLVAGFVAFALLNEAYTALLGDNARGQLAVPAVVVACLALTILLRWNWGWPLAGGVAVGSAVGLAGTLAIGAMFPSQEAITDKAGARRGRKIVSPGVV